MTDEGRRRWRRWNRSSPLVGGVGGFLVASSAHYLDRGPGDSLLTAVVDLPALLDAAPVAGYVLLVTVGVLLGWVARLVEDRYIYPDS